MGLTGLRREGDHHRERIGTLRWIDLEGGSRAISYLLFLLFILLHCALHVCVCVYVR